MPGIKLLAAVLLTFAAARGMAQEHQHGNGEKLGAVHFATSCNEVAQMEFNRAMALLHSFQFSRAIDGFNVVLADDPTCAIAYWGIALSDWTNPFAPGIKDNGQLQLGRENVERGQSVGAKTERERAYLAAVGKLYADFESSPQQARLLAYRDAMRDVAAKYPQDHEAQIFYALALAASEDPADKTFAARLEAGAILEKLFEEEPTHPGIAHYIIHTYDVPALAGRALAAAQRYAADRTRCTACAAHAITYLYPHGLLARVHRQQCSGSRSSAAPGSDGRRIARQRLRNLRVLTDWAGRGGGADRKFFTADRITL